MAHNNWDASLYDSKHSFVTAYGNDIVELLNAQSNELILDIGSGSGELTAKINNLALNAIGIDASANMVDQAKLRFPDITFYQHNAEEPFPFEDKFDAIFSNAALHWMLNPKPVIANIAYALKVNGRFVFEMGGKGNIATIIQAIEFAAQQVGITELPIYNYFPSIGEYASLLEQHGLNVVYAVTFKRPTLLQGEDGLRNWIRMFRNSIIKDLDQEQTEDFFRHAEAFAANKLYVNQQWVADYVRLRMIAIKS